MKKLFRSKKALSPVIAAIILIAVTVAVSIAVAAWMGALTFTFMKTEELKITGYTWTNATHITLSVVNTGSSKVTIVGAQVDDETASCWRADGTPISTTSGYELDKGQSGSVIIKKPSGTWASTKYNFALLTSSGNKYTYQVSYPG